METKNLSTDIEFVKSIIPSHYLVQPSKTIGSIHCVSKVGFRKGIDADDEEGFSLFFEAIKSHFKERFQEIFCNTCFCYIDFTIYLKRSAKNSAP